MRKLAEFYGQSLQERVGRADVQARILSLDPLAEKVFGTDPSDLHRADRDARPQTARDLGARRAAV